VTDHQKKCNGILAVKNITKTPAKNF